jgi:hypothetical protein
VARVIDLNRLAGRPAGGDAERLGGKACEAEFRAFTGLAGSTEDLWLTILTTTGGEQAAATATCIVASRYPRVGTARSIGS